MLILSLRGSSSSNSKGHGHNAKQLGHKAFAFPTGKVLSTFLNDSSVDFGPQTCAAGEQAAPFEQDRKSVV